MTELLLSEPVVVIDDTDPDDYEALQGQAESAGEIPDGGFVTDLFSGALNNAARIDMYRSWVYPDLYPDERPARLGNWNAEDRWAFCGERSTS